MIPVLLNQERIIREAKRWPNQKIFLPLLILLFFISTSFVGAQSKYPKTVYALQERYRDEIHGVHEYLAYAYLMDGPFQMPRQLGSLRGTFAERLSLSVFSGYQNKSL